MFVGVATDISDIAAATTVVVAVVVAVADCVYGGCFCCHLGQTMMYIDHRQFDQIRSSALTHRIDRLTLGTRFLT